MDKCFDNNIDRFLNNIDLRTDNKISENNNKLIDMMISIQQAFHPTIDPNSIANKIKEVARFFDVKTEIKLPPKKIEEANLTEMEQSDPKTIGQILESCKTNIPSHNNFQFNNLNQNRKL